jgi:hypothetical protein
MESIHGFFFASFGHQAKICTTPFCVAFGGAKKPSENCTTSMTLRVASIRYFIPQATGEPTDNS